MAPVTHFPTETQVYDQRRTVASTHGFIHSRQEALFASQAVQNALPLKFVSIP